MPRGLLPRFAFALLAALGLAGQSATSVAHAAAHDMEAHARHAEHRSLVYGAAIGSSAEVEAADLDLDHSALHAVVSVGLVTTLPLFVGSVAVVLSVWAPVIEAKPSVTFAVLARPPGLSAPPPASRAPPIG